MLSASEAAQEVWWFEAFLPGSQSTDAQESIHTILSAFWVDTHLPPCILDVTFANPSWSYPMLAVVLYGGEATSPFCKT